MLFTTTAIFSVLLVLTGIAKLRRPGDVERALRDFGAPTFRGSGVVLGGVEIVVGLGALLTPAVLWAQAVLYLGFALWVIAALRRQVPIASCGCFGRDDTPPTGAHVFLNLVGAAASMMAPLTSAEPIVGAGLGLVAQLVAMIAGAFLAYLVLTEYAALRGANLR